MPKQGRIRAWVDRGSPTPDCPRGFFVKVETTSNLEPRHYRFRYGAAFNPVILGSQEASVNVFVGAPPVLEPKSQSLCITPGGEATVDLVNGGRVDGQGHEVRVRSVHIQMPLMVRADPQNPLAAMLRAPPAPHYGALVYIYRLVAGGIESPDTTVTINDPRQCASAGLQLPPQSPSVKSLKLRDSVIVPIRGGIILAFSDVDLNRTIGTPLPAVRVTVQPKHVSAAAAGQFIVLDVPDDGRSKPTDGQTDSLTWEFDRAADRYRLEVEIVYREICVEFDATEKLIYLPKGRYYFPTGASMTEVQGLARLKQALFPSASFGVNAPFCLQAQEQSLGALLPSLSSIIGSPRVAEIQNAIQREATTLVSGFDDILRYISFDEALKIAEWKSAQPRAKGNKYWIPRSTEWLAGLLVAIELRDPRIGAQVRPQQLRHSFFAGVEEWVDLQPSPTADTQRLGLGPSSSDLEWVRRVPRNVTSRAIGVRFARQL